MRFRIFVSLIAVLPAAAWAAGSSPSSGDVEQRLLSLRPGVEAVGTHSLLMELDTKIAREQALQGRFDEAKALLAKVAADLRPEETGARAQYELELGRVIMTQGDTAGAATHFQNALDAAKTAKRDALAVDAAVMLAVTDPDPVQQIAKSKVALQIAQGSADPAAKSWVASIWNNIGAAYDENHQYKEALDAFTKSRAACATDDCRRIADWKVAHVDRELGNLSQAQTLLEALESQWSAVSARKGPAFDLGDGKDYVFEELGEVHLAQAQADPAAADRERATARAYFAKANTETLQAVGSGVAAPSLLDQRLRIERLKQRAQ
jgi:tetratricopeptide (TPR) repeat protein